MVNEALDLLLVEDSESDAALVARLLEKAGYDVHWERVETPDEMRAALDRRDWRLIVSDHQMGQFDAPAALRILRESGRDLPFIIVSGNIGEELAVAMMKSGAHDYVLKNNLARLVPVVERELREARARREHVRAARDLRDSEERLALAIQATQLGTFDFLPQTGKIVWSAEAKRQFGLRPEAEVDYETFLRSLHPDDRERMEKIIHDLLRPGSDGQYAAEYRTIGIEDHVERWISSWGRVFFDERGLAVRFIGVKLDITGQKRAQEEQAKLREQLQQAQKLESVGRLAGGVAHDFNNLLTVINGYTDMLLKQVGPEDPIHADLTEIGIAGARAAALSQQLLVLSRKNVIQPANVNLNDIVREVEKMLGRVIGEDVRLASDLSPSLGRVLADPGQLHQVLMNLAVNARDAMPHGGTLLIETANVDLDASAVDQYTGVKPGSYVRLKVSDTGAGMTEEVLAHLFEPFFTTKKQGEGTGLGLATVYGIVKQCGGAIQVSSHPDRGTTFTIDLPRADGTSAEQKADHAPSMLLGTETILLVEDQEQVRKMSARVLRAHGYQVLEAGSPEEALRASGRHAGTIHLMLSDIVMPGMNGYELAERIRPLRPSMKIVFMSGYSDRVKLNTGGADQMDAYLAKPFSAEALAAKVFDVLGAPRSTGTVLVVDDEPATRNFLRKVLVEAGYRVAEASNGADAVRYIEIADVDLMITDLAMPVQEGIETIQMLRRSRPGLKTIAISGQFGASVLRAAECLGADASLAKPVQPDELLQAVARVMQGEVL